MTYADLLRFNPWWERKDAINIDREVAEFNKDEIKFKKKKRVKTTMVKGTVKN